MSLLASALRSLLNSYFPPTPSPAKKKLRIAIVGGGVSGLTCAIALVRLGLDVHVYEAAAQFGEVGAAIFVGPNTIPILEKLGVLHTVLFKVLRGEGLWRALTLPFQDRQFFKFVSARDWNDVLCDLPFREFPDDHAFGIHRADFLDSLVHHVNPRITSFNKRCTHVTRSDAPDPTTGLHKHIIHFKDGTTAEADVVIGSDGVKSVVRRYVSDPDWDGGPGNKYVDKHLTYSNNYCYRSLVTAPKARAAGAKVDYSVRPYQYLADHRHLVVAGIKGGTLLNVVAFVTDSTRDFGTPVKEPAVERVSEDDLKADFDGLGDETRALLSCIEKPERWNINVVYPFLDSYVRDTVALVGDSAHGMQPHLGAGAGVGLEDAYCIAELLGHPQTTVENIEIVLRAYSDVRRPRARQVWDGTVNANHMVEGRDPRGTYFEPTELRKQYHDVWHHATDLEFDAAVKLLKHQGVFFSS